MTILKCTSNSNKITRFKYNTLLHLHEFSLVLIKCFLEKPNIFDTNIYSSCRVTFNLCSLCTVACSLQAKSERHLCECETISVLLHLMWHSETTKVIVLCMRQLMTFAMLTGKNRPLTEYFLLITSISRLLNFIILNGNPAQHCGLYNKLLRYLSTWLVHKAVISTI